jgi:hypothetical protein
MNGNRAKNLLWVILTIALLVTWGCASTKGSYGPVSPIKEGTDLSKYSTLFVEVKSNNDIALTTTDKDRILGQIIANINKDYPARFKEINNATPDSTTLSAIVNITRYDKGSSFARFMLAGLGAMHINADVMLKDYETKQGLGTFECKKTFAWGGMYGGSTRIEDIEEGFAKAVAASIAEGKK